MSEQNVALLRGAYERVNEGGFGAIEDFLHPGFEMDSPQGVEASQAHDKPGLQEWFRKMDEIWETLQFDPEEIVVLDDEHVLAVVHTSGRARGSGIEIDQHLSHVWTIREGRAAQLITYSTKEDALEAARPGG
jgi:ketosteroid isomerase-like protein